MTSTANVDYTKTNFEYPVLTKITTKPDYASLLIIKDELKANAASVQCDLGGGQNGYLGLVLTAAEYRFVTRIPFVRPAHPGNVPPTGGTNHETIVLRDGYKEEMRIF